MNENLRGRLTACSTYRMEDLEFSPLVRAVRHAAVIHGRRHAQLEPVRRVLASHVVLLHERLN